MNLNFPKVLFYPHNISINKSRRMRIKMRKSKIWIILENRNENSKPDITASPHLFLTQTGFVAFFFGLCFLICCYLTWWHDFYAHFFIPAKEIAMYQIYQFPCVKTVKLCKVSRRIGDTVHPWFSWLLGIQIICPLNTASLSNHKWIVVLEIELKSSPK